MPHSARVVATHRLTRTLLHRITTLILTITAAALSINSGKQALSSEKAGVPNIVLILADDQGYGDLGCHGNPVLRTPNLDRLHRQSVRLTNFHVDPTCSPTRAALMTGRYSTRVGVWHTVMGRNMPRPGVPMMPEMFSNAGYRTAIFGKWHLGDAYPYRPEDRGFDEVLIHGGGGIGQIPDYWGNDYFDDTFLHDGKHEPFTGYCTDVSFSEAIQFIEHQREKSQPIPAGARSVVFTLPLSEGKGRLETQFTNAQGMSRGAYYVTVERLDE